MKMNKKGIFYTMGLSLLSLALLALAILFFHQANVAETRNIELSFSSKIYDLDHSIQQVFAEALSRNNPPIFHLQNDSWTIEESLPADFTAQNLLLDQLKNSIEKDFSQVNLSLDDFLRNHGYSLIPANITYLHPSSNTFRLQEINSKGSIITGYNLTLNFEGNITYCTNDLAQGGTRQFSFLGLSSGNTCRIIQDNLKEGEIELIVSGNGVSIKLEENGQLSVQSNATVRSSLKINFDELSPPGHIEVPIEIQIGESLFNFSKKSKVDLSSLS